ncbi:hypothetical protein, partial [Salmonella sp. s55004]|uniref:hypothetical protein n=1 Tax=Salmonella sp. s55004 TaxID=3159675 RepID=UPI00397ECD6E
MSIKFYYTSITSSSKLEGQQRKIEQILTARKVELEKIDIASSEEDKIKMRELIGDPKALAPQLFNGDQYCGNFEAFDDAVEGGTIDEFLKF